MHQVVAEYQRFAKLIRRVLPDASPAPGAAETEAAVQVERGVVLLDALVAPNETSGRAIVDRLIRLAAQGRIDQIEFVDAAGHHRDVYRPMTIYAWLVAFRILYEVLPRQDFGRWDEGLRPWCDLLEAELGPLALSDDDAGGGTAAVRGGSVAEAAWTALALHVAGKIFIRDAWTDLAADAFGRLARGQQSSGAFLRALPSDHPELRWYHELAILHAAASYAVQAEDRTIARAVARGTAFVLAEIEPDHATAQPWGLFAFIWNPAARPLADQLLHAVEMRRGAVDGVSLILLADALYCLRLFTDPGPQP
ncbi:MAG: hypothetical protein QOE14_921 [Humisphaera sp.]|nr:hypothetical protein [Humisphaera sp.]